MKKILSLILVVSILFGMGIFQPVSAFAEDDNAEQCRIIKQRYYDSLVYEESSNPDILAAVEDLDANVEDYLSKRLDAEDRMRVFSDYQISAETNPDDLMEGMTYSISNNIAYTMERIYNMAAAYKSPNSKYYKDSELLGYILYDIEWLIDNFYNEETFVPLYSVGGGFVGNWWVWEIYFPRNLCYTCIILEDEIDDATMARYARILDIFVETPFYATGGVAGGNGAWITENVVMISLLRGNPDWTGEPDDYPEFTTRESKLGLDGYQTKLHACQAKANSLINFVTAGDGFYSDGSYIGHGNHAYTAGYGMVLYGVMLQLSEKLAGTNFAVSDDKMNILKSWVFDAYEPMIYDGLFIDSVNGRGTPDTNVVGSTKETLTYVLSYINAAEGEDKLRAQSMVKYWGQCLIKYWDGDESKLYTGLAPDKIVLLRAIMDDDSIESRGEIQKSHIFPMMCRAVDYNPTWGAAISFYDDRICSYENGGDFTNGWHINNGMLYLYNDVPNVYSGNYWATVDAWKHSGTTVVQDSRMPLGGGTSSGQRNSGWGGGVEMDDENIAVAFYLKPMNDSGLNAYKSYFAFDDEIVCLGSGISATTEGKSVWTTFENRKITDYDTGKFIVDGEESIAAMGDTAQIIDASWAWLEGPNDDAHIGYYFPQKETINVKRESRSGKFSDIGRYGSSEEVTDSYITMYKDHGAVPEAGTYQYVLLPDMTAEEVEAYSNEPKVEILAFSDNVHAVRQTEKDITAVNFYTDTKAEVDGLVSSDKTASVIMKKNDGITTVGISDPTMKNTGKIRLSFANLYSFISKDDRIEVISCGKDGLVIDVDVNGAKGETITFACDDSKVMTELLSENFEDKEGSIAGGVPQNGIKTWVCTGAADIESALVQETEDRDGNSTKALFFDSQNEELTVTYPQLPAIGDYTVSMWIYDEFVEDSVSNFTVNLANSFVGFDVNGEKSGVWRCRMPGETDSSDVLTKDGETIARVKGWHKFEIKVEDGIGIVYIDGVKTNVADKIDAVAFAQHSGWYSGSTKNIIYVDDIAVTSETPCFFTITDSTDDTVTVKVKENTYYEGDYTAVAAAYENGTLAEVHFVNKAEITDDEKRSFEFAIDKDNTELRFMVWNNLNSMEPLKNTKVGTVTELENEQRYGQGIETFMIRGEEVVIDEETGVITVSVSEILKPTATYTLKNGIGALDIEQGAVVEDGQIITYINGDLEKAYTISLTTVPFDNYDVPEGFELVEAIDCSTDDGWTLSGTATATDDAYGYNGYAVKGTAKDSGASYTFNNAVRKNALVTMKFYSADIDHSFGPKFIYLGADGTTQTGTRVHGNVQVSTNSGKYIIRNRSLAKVNTSVEQSIGWHELVASIDANGTVTYYIDGAEAYSEMISTGETLIGVGFEIPGWGSYSREGAITDIKVYAIPKEGIKTFSIGGIAAVVDEDTGVITASISEILKPNVTYTLENDIGTLDIEQGATVKDGQTITYTKDGVTKTYTISLTKIPLTGYEVPEDAELIETIDCSTDEGWSLSGSTKITEGAYDYNGYVVESSVKNDSARYVFTNPVSKNALVTMKFYSANIASSFVPEFRYSDDDFMGVSGNIVNVNNGKYTFIGRGNNRCYGNSDSSQIAQSVGWHEMAAVLDANGNVTYYIDGQLITKGTAEYSEKLPAGVTLNGVGSDVYGWNSYLSGAITDIKVYKLAEAEDVPEEEQGIETFEILSEEAIIDEENGTITASVYEILKPTVTYTLKYGLGALDIEQGTSVEDGQVITYTNGDVTKTYTVSLTSVPFVGLDIADATRIYNNACADSTDWTLSGAAATEEAYSYNGSAIKSSAKEQNPVLTLPKGTQLGENALLTMKFYSATTNHSYYVGAMYSNNTTTMFGGNNVAVASGYYKLLNADSEISKGSRTFYDINVPISIGWHELAVKIDNEGVVTYYIDGELITQKDGTAYSETLSDGATLSGIKVWVPGWSYGVEGAVTDISVYKFN